MPELAGLGGQAGGEGVSPRVHTKALLFNVSSKSTWVGVGVPDPEGHLCCLQLARNVCLRNRLGTSILSPLPPSYTPSHTL